MKSSASAANRIQQTLRRRSDCDAGAEPLIRNVVPPMRAPLFAVLVMLLATSPASAKVATIQFDELVNLSDLIVVATVESVNDPLIGNRYAKARVTEVWKGARTEYVRFLATPTWTCDVTEAKLGETVVLFLIRSKGSRAFQIAHSGRGRMPQRTVGGKSYADFWPDIRVPRETPTVSGLHPDRAFIRSIEVSFLHDLVRRAREVKR